MKTSSVEKMCLLEALFVWVRRLVWVSFALPRTGSGGVTLESVIRTELRSNIIRSQSLPGFQGSNPLSQEFKSEVRGENSLCSIHTTVRTGERS